MIKNNYLNLINENSFTNEKQQTFSPINLLNLLRSKLIVDDEMITLDKYLLRISCEKSIHIIYCDYLRSSGIINNLNKRLHVRTINNKHFFNSMPIGIYASGKKVLFVYFSCNQVLEKKSNFNKSVWVDFSHLFYAIEKQIDVKYLAFNKSTNSKYYIYITNDIYKILNQDFKNFYEVSKDIIENIKQVLEKQRVDIVETDKFSNKNIDINLKNIVTDVNSSNKHVSECAEIGKLGEQKFYEMLLHRKTFLENMLNINLIETFEWVNIQKESYKPYDFIINENIYIDVKSTVDKDVYFVMSDDEIKFMNSCQSDKNYLIANICDIYNSEKSDMWRFFYRNELNEKNFSEKTSRIYGN